MPLWQIVLGVLAYLTMGFGLGIAREWSAQNITNREGDSGRYISAYVHFPCTFQSNHFPLLDEPTNNLDPASRDEILAALGEYQGAVILVSHDEGAVRALKPERVLLLPDGDEDLWNDEYLDLIALE